jgi:hypothetical protein
MSQFDFLSVLVSIIIALGISHILTSTARLFRHRGRYRPYAPTLIWMAILFLLLVQIWWVAFYRRELAHWTFFGFLLYLLIPALATLPGYLLLPDGDQEWRRDLDLEKEFSHNRTGFFGILGSVVAASLIEDAVRSGTLTLNLNAVMRLLFLALCFAGTSVRSKVAQTTVALVFLALFLAYIGFVFWSL